MNKLVQTLRKALTKLGIQESNKLVWGYGHKKSEVDKEIIEYYHAAKLLRDQELVGYECLTKKEKEAIISGIGRVTGVQCDESEYDYTKEDRPDKDRWLLQNPDCVAYEYYADYIAAQCKKLSLDLKVIRIECEKVGINLDVKKQTFCDAIELILDVKEQKCDIDIDVKVDLQKCIIDFETIVVPRQCDIDFKTFVHQISCGATVDVIVSGLNCAVGVNVTTGDAICPSSSSLSASPSPSSSISPSNSPSVSESISPSGSPVDFDFDVTTEDVTICYYTDIVVSLDNVTDENADFTWDWEFGSGAVYDGDTGLGPHTVRWTTNGVKTITVTGNDGFVEIERTLQVTVSTCLGNITGSVMSSVGTPIQGANVRLYTDEDADGVPNATLVRNVFTNSGGTYSMASLTPGNYVIHSITPANYTILSGIDTSEDSDVVPNTNTGDIYIPVTILPSEIDFDNHFIYTPNTGTISGTVLDDLGNPISGATVGIYRDDNMDGVSDGALESSGVTNGSGAYSISGLFVGYDISAGTPKSHYVIVLTVPIGYTIVSGIDTSGDSDAVPNTDTTNNIIPCTLTPGEVDANNNFIIQL